MKRFSLPFIFTLLIIFVSLVLAPLVLVYRPLQNELRQSLQKNFARDAEKSLLILENQLERCIENAESLSSRTMIREEAWKYYQGDISLEELKSFTAPKWLDGLDALQGPYFAARYIREAEVVSSGSPLDLMKYDVLPCEKTSLEMVDGPEGDLFLVCSPIREGDLLLGYDLVAYSVAAFLSDMNSDSSFHRLVKKEDLEVSPEESEGIMRKSEEESSIFLPVSQADLYLESYMANDELYRESDLMASKISIWFGIFAAFIAFCLAYVIQRRNLSQISAMRELQEKLQASEERFRILFDKESDMVLVQQLDPESRKARFIEANDSALGRLDYSRDDLLEVIPEEVLLFENKGEMIHFFKKLKEDKKALWEMTALSSKGRRIPVEVHSHLFEMEGKTTILTVARDISDRKAVENALRENEKRYSSIFNNSEAVMLLIDPRSEKIEDANEAACAFYGYTCNELIGEPFSLILSTDPSEVFRMMQLASTDQQKHFYLETKLAHGIIRQVEVYVSNITVSGRELLFLIIHDLSDEIDAEKKVQKLNEELMRISNTDKLTGVINRRHFEEILGWEIDKARRYKDSLSLVMFDLDRFKEINDRFGHKRGDLVLREISKTCRSNIRSSDFLARWGGDEFMILTPVKLQEAIILAEKIRSMIEELDLGVTASLGVTEFVAGDNMDTLTTRVDDLLYEAKEQGRNLVIQG